MLLASSIEPNGPKSTKHYLVLHFNNRRHLVRLPKSYSDLERQVGKLYHVEPGAFCVEIEDLNVCNGQRVMVSGEDWEDIAEILGNVHIVPLEHKPEEGAYNSRPEAFPESERKTETTAYTANQGVIPFGAPLIKDGFLVINVGNIDFGVKSTSATKFNIQLLDGNQTPLLTISIFPLSGSVFLNSQSHKTSIVRPLGEIFSSEAANGHHLIVYKKDNTFKLLCDFDHIGSVQAPTHSPLTAARYDLGMQSPFKSPMSATVFTSLPDLRQRFGSIFESIDGETLFQQILLSNSGDAPYITEALRAIRLESSAFESSVTGIKWQGRKFPVNVSTDMEWRYQLQSVLVVWFNLTAECKPATKMVVFGPGGPPCSPLRIDVNPQNEVTFHEYTGNGWPEIRPRIKLPFTMLSPGQHSIAFVNQGTELTVFFDFSESISLSNTKIMARMPKQFRINVGDEDKCSVQVDVYEFDL